MLLVTGPSSSGKTTTSKKLEIYLKARGYKTHSISIDDYFYNRIYFVYSDDSNDGIDNPHWAIADIKYLEKENPDE